MRHKVSTIVKEKKIPKRQVLQVVKQTTRDEYELESEEVKAAILQELEEQKEAATLPAEYTPRDFAE